jgi:hypothetical protein
MSLRFSATPRHDLRRFWAATVVPTYIFGIRETSRLVRNGWRVTQKSPTKSSLGSRNPRGQFN